MGMSLDTVSGVGLLLDLKEDDYGLEDPSEMLEVLLEDFKHLSYSVARFGDWVGGAAIFADSTAFTTSGITPIEHKPCPDERTTNDELSELWKIAEELKIPFRPKYITLVRYR